MSTIEPADSLLRFEPGAALRSALAQQLLLEERITLMAGERIGEFRVVREIGRGGLGAVYLAVRSDVDFDQRVALKVISSRSDRQLAEALLTRERQVLARLIHPNIARLVSGGSSGDLLWFAMEYVEGTRIDEHCNASRLTGRQRVELFLQVCAAVTYAHSQLVVHRDLKAANVLVTSIGEVRLLDFGIAGSLDQPAHDPARSANTPGTASPEQQVGQPVGVASDIHQLGQLLAHLLHGIAPVAGRQQDTQAILHRALAARPEDRYRSVEAFALDLRRLLDLQPVAAWKAPAAIHLHLFVRRHPWSVVGALLLFAALATSNIWYLARVDHARQMAEREARSAQHIARFMIDVFSGAGPDKPRSAPADVESLMAAGAERALGDLTSEPELQESLLTVLAGVYMVALANPKAAAPLYERALAIAALRDGGSVLPQRERIARAHLYASALRDLGRLPEAYAVIEQAKASLDDRPEHYLPRADLLGVQAGVAYQDRKIDDSIRLFDAAIAEARRRGPDEPTVHFLQLNQNIALRGSGQHQKAISSLREALASAERLSGQDHSSTIHARVSLADSLLDSGNPADLDEADRLLIDALARLRRIDGERSMRTLSAQALEARLQWRRGFPDAARHDLSAVLVAIDALPDGTQADRPRILRDLGDIALGSGDAPAALERYRAMEKSMVAIGSIEFGDYSIRSACAWLALDDPRQAEAFRERAWKLAADANSLHPIHADLRSLHQRCSPAAVKAGLATFAS